MISTSELQSEGYPDSLIRLYEKHPEAREIVLDYKNYIMMMRVRKARYFRGCDGWKDTAFYSVG